MGHGWAQIADQSRAGPEGHGFVLTSPRAGACNRGRRSVPPLGEYLPPSLFGRRTRAPPGGVRRAAVGLQPPRPRGSCAPALTRHWPRSRLSGWRLRSGHRVRARNRRWKVRTGRRWLRGRGLRGAHHLWISFRVGQFLKCLTRPERASHLQPTSAPVSTRVSPAPGLGTQQFSLPLQPWRTQEQRETRRVNEAARPAALTKYERNGRSRSARKLTPMRKVWSTEGRCRAR